MIPLGLAKSAALADNSGSGFANLSRHACKETPLKNAPQVRRLILIKVCIKGILLALLLVGEAHAGDTAVGQDSGCHGAGATATNFEGFAGALAKVQREWKSDGASAERWVKAAETCAPVSRFEFAFHVRSEIPVRRQRGSASEHASRRFFVKADIGDDGFPRFSVEGIPPKVRMFFGDIRSQGTVEDKSIEVRAVGYGSAEDVEAPPEGTACAGELARLFAEVLKSSAERLLDQSRFGEGSELSI